MSSYFGVGIKDGTTHLVSGTKKGWEICPALFLL